VDVAGRGADLSGDLALGMAVGVEEKAGFLLGGEDLKGGFEVELGEELLLDLVGEALLDFLLGRAEGLGPLLDLAQIEVAKAFAAAQRRIPRWDPDRLALHHQKRGGPNPNGFEPPLLRPLGTGL